MASPSTDDPYVNRLLKGPVGLFELCALKSDLEDCRIVEDTSKTRCFSPKPGLAPWVFYWFARQRLAIGVEIMLKENVVPQQSFFYIPRHANRLYDMVYYSHTEDVLDYCEALAKTNTPPSTNAFSDTPVDAETADWLKQFIRGNHTKSAAKRK